MKNILVKTKKLVISFKNPSDSFKMEKYVRENNLGGRLIPLPPEIDVGCGVAYATENLDENYWKDVLEKNDIDCGAMKVLML